MPPAYSPTTKGQPRKIAITNPSSTTRLVEASMKASEGTRPAPFWKSARVVARAAKLQELEMKPKKLASSMLRGPSVPMARCMRWRVTSTWIRLLIR